MEKINAKEKTYRKGDSGPKYFFNGPRFEWGELLLKPNESLGEHYHKEVEETFYLLEGKAKMIINKTEIEAEAGDLFRLEPGETHDIINETEKNIKFIFIKVPYKPEDKFTL